jgi:hypothetical protein
MGMSLVVFLTFWDQLPPGAMVALMLPMSLEEIGLAVGLAVTLLGVLLCWQVPHRRMSLEERVKDGKITEEQAYRRIRRLAWTGPVVTLVGVSLLCGVLLN